MKFIDYIVTNKKIQNITQKIINSKTYKNVYVFNSCSNYSRFITANYFLKTKKNIIYVTDNIYHATEAYDVLLDLLGEENVGFFPVEEFITLNSIASSNMYRLARMKTIEKILNNVPQVIITSTEGMLKNTLSVERLKSSILRIGVDEIYEKNKLINDLVIRGYKKQIITETQGTFSIRGEVVDIFPINYDNPIRINYFDDQIEEIRLFNVNTQLTYEKTDSAIIYPLNEIFYDNPNEVINNIKMDLENNPYTNSLFDSILNYDNLDKLYIYLPYIDENYQRFIDIIKDKEFFFENYNDCLNREKEENVSILEFMELHQLTNCRKIMNFIPNMVDLIINEKNVLLNRHKTNILNFKFDELIDANTIEPIDYKNNFKNLMDNVEANYNSRIEIIIAEDEKRLNQLVYSLDNRKIEYKVSDNFQKVKNGIINISICPDSYGFIDLEDNIEIITPKEYANSSLKNISKFQKFYKNSVKVYDKEELDIGDYIVHETYGIGKYIGIETIDIKGKLCDYLTFLYENNDVIKIPVENIHTIEKYIGTSDKVPKLSNLRKKDWNKKKSKIKDEVTELAKRLIAIEQERSNKKGFIYPKDDEYQVAFEKDFGFIETDDQLKAIEEVKNDLESGILMDRVLCGDVGFGKTEVAMRAAFKVVSGGRQVAYLAPTTVLSRQHYYSFKERFEKYGIRVQLLNRFISEEKQKNIFEEVKTGFCEILIGTHRILSNNLKFKNLGLLIIDEEQRFGVEQKERFKELKSDIDVLSLSATPIPRTLQMSLVGVKDLSLIETPPVNRVPVQTYVLEANDSIIREAIHKELSRGGQVFYLLNRIGELNIIVKKVRKLCPEAKVAVIHGQLSKEEIEIELDSFINKETNVLICTTIIETGIDIPNANTLIVERSDLLGLSQLYQIRGRVGRSDRIAYAYFLYNSNQVLTENSIKRLNSIKEFTSLGSGYKIAMRDLTIRGAGDILGKEQSGFIDDIGINTYLKLLNQEVQKQKGVKTSEELKKYSVSVSHHIDALYVGDDAIRIEMHQQISKVRSRNQAKLLISQYNDRFGKLDEDVVLYIEAKYLEFLLISKGIEEFKEEINLVNLTLSTEKSKEFFNKCMDNELANLVKNIKLNIVKNKVNMVLNNIIDNKSYIYTLTKVLEKL